MVDSHVSRQNPTFHLKKRRTFAPFTTWRQPQNPAKKALQLGIPISINTDDPVLFQSSLAQELSLARLTDEEIKTIQETGRRYGYKR